MSSIGGPKGSSKLPRWVPGRSKARKSSSENSAPQAPSAPPAEADASGSEMRAQRPPLRPALRGPTPPAAAPASAQAASGETVSPPAPIASPREAMAYLMTTLMGVADKSPELQRAQQTSEAHFLAGVVPVATAIALLGDVGRAANAANLPAVRDRCEALKAQIGRDPVPTATLAATALGALAKVASQPLLGVIRPLHDELNLAIHADPGAPGSKQDLVLDILGRVDQAIDNARYGLRMAHDTIDRRDMTLDEREAQLKVALREARVLNAPAMHTEALSEAIATLHDAKVLTDLRMKVENQKLGGALMASVHQNLGFEPAVLRHVAIERLRQAWSDLPTDSWPAVARAVAQADARGSFVAPIGLPPEISRSLKDLDRADRQAMGKITGSAREALAALSLFTGSGNYTHKQAQQEGLLSKFDDYCMHFTAKAPITVRARLHAIESGGDADSGVALLGPTATIIKSSLRALEPALTSLNDNLTGRAFETALARSLIDHMPQQTQQMWTELSAVMVDLFETFAAGPGRLSLKLANDDFAEAMRDRGSRPWDNRSPQMQHLVDAALHGPASLMIGRALAVLRQPIASGVDVLTRANLIRELWLVLKDYNYAPNSRSIDHFYREQIGPRTGRTLQISKKKPRKPDVGRPKFKLEGPNKVDTRTGVIAAHQLKVVPPEDATPATRPSLKNHSLIDHDTVAYYLRQGHVTASGISGSANILLGFFDHAVVDREQNFAVRDLLLGATSFLLHDGGHSVQEVMWVVDNAHDHAYRQPRDGVPPGSYAQFKAIFADVPEVMQAFDEAIGSLAQLHGALENPKPR